MKEIRIKKVVFRSEEEGERLMTKALKVYQKASKPDTEARIASTLWGSRNENGTEIVMIIEYTPKDS